MCMSLLNCNYTQLTGDTHRGHQLMMEWSMYIVYKCIAQVHKQNYTSVHIYTYICVCVCCQTVNQLRCRKFLKAINIMLLNKCL